MEKKDKGFEKDKNIPKDPKRIGSKQENDRSKSVSKDEMKKHKEK